VILSAAPAHILKLANPIRTWFCEERRDEWARTYQKDGPTVYTGGDLVFNQADRVKRIFAAVSEWLVVLLDENWVFPHAYLVP
jgi:hypothetical protein